MRILALKKWTESEQESVHMLESLVKKLKSVVISPKGIFNVTTTTLISVVALIANYLIIVINFKLVIPENTFPCTCNSSHGDLYSLNATKRHP